MKKEVQPVEDSVTHFVKIKNTVAKKYFDYQLCTKKPPGLSSGQEVKYKIMKKICGRDVIA